MADAAGQQGLSPYHAMACNPSTMTDPLGLAPKTEGYAGGVPEYGNEMAMRFLTMPNFMARYLTFGDRTADRSMAEQEREAADIRRKKNEEATTGGDIGVKNEVGAKEVVTVEIVGRKTGAQLQDGDYDCVYECFSMVMQQFGYTIYAKKIKKIATIFQINTEEGVAPDDVVKFGKMLGLDISPLNEKYNRKTDDNEQLAWNALKSGSTVMFLYKFQQQTLMQW